MRLHESELVPESEIENAVVRQDAVNISHNSLWVDNVLIDVIEHNDVHLTIVERKRLPSREPEIDSIAKPLAGSRETRFVDVDTRGHCASTGDLVSNETGGTTDV